MEYFNYITQENESIDTAKDFYFIRGKHNNGFCKFIVSPQIVELLKEDALTKSQQYYRVKKSWVMRHQALLFPNNMTRSEPLLVSQLAKIIEDVLKDEDWQEFGLMRDYELPVRIQIQMLLEPVYEDSEKHLCLCWLSLFCRNELSGRVFWGLEGVDALFNLMYSTKNLDLLSFTIRLVEYISVHDFIQEALNHKERIAFLINLLITSNNHLELQKSIVNILISIAAKKSRHGLFYQAQNFQAVISLAKKSQSAQLSSELTLFLYALSVNEKNHTNLQNAGVISYCMHAIDISNTTDIKKMLYQMLIQMSMSVRGRGLIQFDNGLIKLLAIHFSIKEPILKSLSFKLLKSLMGSIENTVFPIAIVLGLAILPTMHGPSEVGSYMFGVLMTVLAMLARTIIVDHIQLPSIKLLPFFTIEQQHNHAMEVPSIEQNPLIERVDDIEFQPV